jgi:hypothetical protein
MPPERPTAHLWEVDGEDTSKNSIAGEVGFNMGSHVFPAFTLSRSFAPTEETNLKLAGTAVSGFLVVSYVLEDEYHW